MRAFKTGRQRAVAARAERIDRGLEILRINCNAYKITSYTKPQIFYRSFYRDIIMALDRVSLKYRWQSGIGFNGKITRARKRGRLNKGNSWKHYYFNLNKSFPVNTFMVVIGVYQYYPRIVCMDYQCTKNWKMLSIIGNSEKGLDFNGINFNDFLFQK